MRQLMMSLVLKLFHEIFTNNTTEKLKLLPFFSSTNYLGIKHATQRNPRTLIVHLHRIIILSLLTNISLFTLIII